MNRLVTTLSCLSAFGLAAVGLSGCNSALGYAAKVNGSVVPRSLVDQELADIAKNKDFVTKIDQPGAAGPFEGSTKGSYNKAFVAILLNQQIRFELIHQTLAAQKALPPKDQLATAKGEVVGQFTQKIFDAFPARYQNLLLTQQAEADVFIKNSDAAVDGYYKSHVNDYQTEACVRHILLAETGANRQVDFPASLAMARQVAAQLAGGADFATVAKAQSKDNQGTGGGSAAQGGTLTGSAPDGCITSQDLQRVVAPFAQAVVALPANKVSDPVQTTFGYHLIEVTSRVIQPLDAKVKADILQRLGSARLNELLKVANVKVNPEFGSFDRQATAAGRITGVVAPKVPDAVTTTTAPTGPPGG